MAAAKRMLAKKKPSGKQRTSMREHIAQLERENANYQQERFDTREELGKIKGLVHELKAQREAEKRCLADVVKTLNAREEEIKVLHKMIIALVYGDGDSGLAGAAKVFAAAISGRSG